MAVKKPVVMSSSGTNLFEQLQAGDSISGASSGPELVAGTSPITGLTIGNPVYMSASPVFDKAKADNMATSKVVGLVSATVGASVPFTFQHSDTITLTTAQWDAITGGAGGLSVNSTYYLDPTTAGRITATKPSTVGQVVVQVLYALSTTVALLTIRDPVQL